MATPFEADRSAGSIHTTAPVPTSLATATPAHGRRDARAVRGAGPALPALTRARGGTFSPTVDVIHFADGSSAYTDLIRLNPNVDAYSLDFAGISPRQLSHYRELGWEQAASGFPGLSPRRVARVLGAGYPAVPTAVLTRRLRAAGYHLGPGVIPEHEAIAATQAAIWRFTNGLELDTRPLDLPIRASARVGPRPGARRLVPSPDGSLHWVSQLPAGRTAYLEITLPGRPELRLFSFRVGPRTGRHRCRIRLEASPDGVHWRPVSHAAVQLDDRRTDAEAIHRRLGAAATLSSAGPDGRMGHRHYRLAALGPERRDGLLDLHDVRLEISGGARFRNSARVVALYEWLLAAARDRAASTRPVPVRLLIGSCTPGGPAMFTPLVSIADESGIGAADLLIRPGPDAARPARPTTATISLLDQEPLS